MTSLSIALLTLTSAQFGLDDDFYWQQLGYRPSTAELVLSQLVIVKATKSLPIEKRLLLGPDNSRPIPVAVEVANVLSSNTELSGEVRIVRAVLRYDPYVPSLSENLFRFDIGKTYLVAVWRSAGDDLVLPQGTGGRESNPTITWKVPLERKHANEVMGLAAFATQQSKLDLSAESAIDRLMVNVALCAMTDDTAALNRSLLFLKNAQLGTFDYAERGFATGEWTRRARIPDGHPVIAVLEAALRNQGPSNTARILSLFAYWNVSGAGRRLMEALRTAAFDANLGAIANDSFNRDADLGPDAVLDGDESDSERRTKLDSIVRLALQAKSRAARYLLLNNSSFTDDTTLQKQILELAVRSEEFEAMFLFRYLSSCAKDKELEPKMAQVGGSMKWVNRQQLIDFWKERLGLPPLIAAQADRGS